MFTLPPDTQENEFLVEAKHRSDKVLRVRLFAVGVWCAPIVFLHCLLFFGDDYWSYLIVVFSAMWEIAFIPLVVHVKPNSLFSTLYGALFATFPLYLACFSLSSSVPNINTSEHCMYEHTLIRWCMIFFFMFFCNFVWLLTDQFHIKFSEKQQSYFVLIKMELAHTIKHTIRTAAPALLLFCLFYYFIKGFLYFPINLLFRAVYPIDSLCSGPNQQEYEIVWIWILLKGSILQIMASFIVRFIIQVYKIISSRIFTPATNPFWNLDDFKSTRSSIYQQQHLKPYLVTLFATFLKTDVDSLQLLRYQAFQDLVYISTTTTSDTTQIRRAIFHNINSWTEVGGCCIDCIKNLTQSLDSYLKYYLEINKPQKQKDTTLINDVIFEKLHHYRLFFKTIFEKRTMRRQIFLDFYPQICSIRALSHLMEVARKERVDEFDVPCVLDTMLSCLQKIKAYRQSAMNDTKLDTLFTGVSYTTDIPDTIEDVLTKSIQLLLRTWPEKKKKNKW